MSRIILILTVAVVMFVGAAALSWYLQPQPPDPELANSKEGDAKVDKKQAKKDSASKNDAPDFKYPGKTFPNNPEANRVATMMANIIHREETLKAREQHLVMREKQLTAIHDEVKKEHGKLELVRKEIQIELNNVKKKLEEVELRTASAAKEKRDVVEELEKLSLLVNGVKTNDAKNAQKHATIFDKMDPEPLSKMLIQWAESGKSDEAAILLSHMKPSQTATVLAELTNQDPAISTKLFDRMQKIQITDAKK